MKKMELWYCDDFPTSEEIVMGVDLANKQDRYVLIHYRVNGYGATSLVQIEPGDTADTVRNKLTVPFIGGADH